MYCTPRKTSQCIKLQLFIHIPKGDRHFFAVGPKNNCKRVSSTGASCLFPSKTKKTMKQKEQMVLVEDFNIDTLRQAFMEGRLYILPSATTDDIHQEGIRSILQYVSRIDTCASSQYAPTIHRLWEEILHSPQLGPLFFLGRYRSSRGRPNWYRVNAVVMALLEHNVYRKDAYTALQLHMLMEQTTVRTNHYSGMNRYLLQREEMALLLQLL